MTSARVTWAIGLKGIIQAFSRSGSVIVAVRRWQGPIHKYFGPRPQLKFPASSQVAPQVLVQGARRITRSTRRATNKVTRSGHFRTTTCVARSGCYQAATISVALILLREIRAPTKVLSLAMTNVRLIGAVGDMKRLSQAFSRSRSGIVAARRWQGPIQKHSRPRPQLKSLALSQVAPQVLLQGARRITRSTRRATNKVRGRGPFRTTTCMAWSGCHKAATVLVALILLREIRALTKVLSLAMTSARVTWAIGLKGIIQAFSRSRSVIAAVRRWQGPIRKHSEPHPQLTFDVDPFKIKQSSDWTTTVCKSKEETDCAGGRSDYQPCYSLSTVIEHVTVGRR